MSLTASEKEELAALREKFKGPFSSFYIDEYSVYGRIFDTNLVEEDKKYEYECKLDDTEPGVRKQRLGTAEEFNRYLELQKREKT